MRSLRINGFKTDAPYKQCIVDELFVKVWSDASMGVLRRNFIEFSRLWWILLLMTQKRVWNSRDRQAISVRATDSLLYNQELH